MQSMDPRYAQQSVQTSHINGPANTQMQNIRPSFNQTNSIVSLDRDRVPCVIDTYRMGLKTDHMNALLPTFRSSP